MIFLESFFYFFNVMSILPSSPRIVVIGDIHGDIQRLARCCIALKLVNGEMEWIAEPSNTILVQMGDQIDSFRGNENSWEQLPDLEVMRFMDKLHQQALKKGGRVISMLGNHELMNMMGDFSYVSPKSLELVGGAVNRAALFSYGNEFWRRLHSRPPILKIGSVLFAHAGVLPHHIEIMEGDLTNAFAIFHKVLHKQLPENELFKLNRLFLDLESLLWTRYYTLENEEEVQPKVDKVLELTQTKMICVGHTVHPEIQCRFQGKVWFVDNGISRSFFEEKPMDVLEIWHDGVPCPENQDIPILVIRIM
jgi:hypothetical protein